jgi:hypothetical protein
MASRNNVRVVASELLEIVEKLKNIYFGAPSNNKSVEKVCSLSIVVSTHFSVLRREMPESQNQQAVFAWCIEEGCARYLLEHIDITQINKIRILKMFTSEESILIPQYIERIQYLWEVLRKRLPWETFVTNISLCDPSLQEQYHKVLPKEWSKCAKAIG